MKYRIGIDLGGTNIAGGLVDENFKIVAKASVPTVVTEGPEKIVEDISSLCSKLCEDFGLKLSEVASIGIASPGIANHFTGAVEYSCNLPMRKFPISELVSEKTGVSHVFVENDAHLHFLCIRLSQLRTHIHNVGRMLVIRSTIGTCARIGTRYDNNRKEQKKYVTALFHYCNRICSPFTGL